MKMTIRTIFLFSFLTVIASCRGQNQKFDESKVEKFAATYIGETVPDIGRNIDCILQDKKGNYWFGSNGDGVYRWDGKTMTHFSVKEGLCSNYVLSIQEDINGNLWFSVRDGVCCYNGITFTDFTNSIENAAYGKLQYKKGGLFFGHLNGVCFFDGKSFVNFVIHPGTYTPAPNDMNRPYGIYSTLSDKEGNVWFGTQSQGVCSYNGTSYHYLTGKNLDGPAVRTIFQDKSGILWFGNNGGGLYRYDGKTLTNITDAKGLGNPEFLKGHFNDKPGSLARVWSINEDDEGNLWIGTIDAGVWKFNGTDLTNYTTKDGLAGNSIWTIYKDNKGELWFVTNGDAVCKFDGKTFSKYAFHRH